MIKDLLMWASFATGVGSMMHEGRIKKDNSTKHKNFDERLKHIDSYHCDYTAFNGIKDKILNDEEYVEFVYEKIGDSLLNIYGENYKIEFPLSHNSEHFRKLVLTGERQGYPYTVTLKWILDMAARLVLSKDGKIVFPMSPINVFPENKSILLEINRNLEESGADIKYVYCPKNKEYHIEGLCFLDNHMEVESTSGYEFMRY